MSLVATASEWTNDNQTRKRQSTMRKTVKIRPYNDSTGDMDPDEYVSTSENYQNLQSSSPPTISDIQTSNTEKSSRVNEMLNKITSFNSENDGNKLADFQPLQHGNLTNTREPSKDANSYKTTQPSRNLDPSELLPQTLTRSSGSGEYLANASKNDYSNYKETYENSTKSFQNQPYYSKMGIGATTGSGDEKITEKINYMIHLLEENQMEKTAHITEEFLLYLFLGIFVIFTVDSFTRAGKYVR